MESSNNTQQDQQIADDLAHRINLMLSNKNTVDFPSLSFMDQDNLVQNSGKAEKVLLTSYPRSGNTLIRSYLEKITNIYTGSDCDLTRKLNKDLLEMGMNGEGKIDDSVWIVKTHYPERIGHTEFKAHKCIVIVRSPIDCIASLFNMIATGSHNQSIEDDNFEKVRHIWEDFVKEELKVWSDFHYYWTKSPQSIPTHLIRYEDLLLKPYETLTELFQFLLNRNSLEDLKIQQLIQQVTMDAERPEVYKPRSGKINASKKYYTKEQLSNMRQVAYRQIRRLGYLKINKEQENPTGFISEDEEEEKTQVDKEHKDHMAWFNDFNTKMLNASIKSREQFKEDALQRINITVNKKDQIVRIKSKEDPTARGSRKYKAILRDLLQ